MTTMTIADHLAADIRALADPANADFVRFVGVYQRADGTVAVSSITALADVSRADTLRAGVAQLEADAAALRARMAALAV